MPRIFLADPAVKDQRGHHFRLTQTISDNLVDQGFDVVWLVNHQFGELENQPQAVRIHRAFREDTYAAHRQRQAGEQQTKSDAPTGDRPEKYARAKAVYRLIPQRHRNWLTPRLRSFLHFARHGEWLPVPAVEDHSQGPLDAIQTPRKRIRANVAKQMELTKTKPATGKLSPGQEIYRALLACDCRPEEAVLFHTCDAHTYRDVLQFYLNVATVAEWNNFPAFHLSTPYDELVMPHNAFYPAFDLSVRRLGNLGLIGRKVFLHAENRLLAAHLEAMLGYDVTPLPIPPVKLPSADRHATGTWSVCYLGAARTEKGFVQVAEAIASVLAAESWPDLRFVIQVSPQIMGYTPDVQSAVDSLKRIDDSRLTLLEETLSSEEYDSVLMDADVMLLCYDQHRYAKRSSGIAVECAVSCTSMITTRGTFPAFLANEKSLETGPDDVASIVAAIRSSYLDRDRYRETARQRQRSYLAEHSGQAFAGELFRKSLWLQDPREIPQPRFEDTTPWKRLIHK